MSTLKFRGQSTLAPQSAGTATPQAVMNNDIHAQTATMSSPSTIALRPTTRPLASVPFGSLLRSILLHSVTASTFLFRFLNRILGSNIDRLYLDSYYNPLSWILYYTFYKHFCAGRTANEIESVTIDLRKLGVAGLILAYAREIELGDVIPSEAEERNQLNEWLEGTKRTLEYTAPGDFVAVKYSGAGPRTLRLLGTQPPMKPTPELAKALETICDLAAKRGVRLLMDAEYVNVQHGIHEWNLDLMRKYNKPSDGRALIYNTYQMYLKTAPKTLAHHLALAKSENWKLGVKLVRGAYLSSDPRDKICDSQMATDNQYNEAVKMLFDAQHGAQVALVLATHNKDSVRMARAAAKAANFGDDGAGVRELSYAQLMGMADDLSFGLAAEGKHKVEEAMERGEANPKAEVKVYKYIVWGSIQECVQYLLRRAQENQTAVGRSRENVEACWAEMKYRLGLRS